MRWIGAGVVMLTLVLGAGGVARRPHAEPAAESARSGATTGVPASDSAEAATPAPEPSSDAPVVPLDVLASAPTSADAATSCRTVTPQRPVGVRIDLSKVKVPEGFVPLNSRGYNYRRPGEAPVTIPSIPAKPAAEADPSGE